MKDKRLLTRFLSILSRVSSAKSIETHGPSYPPPPTHTPWDFEKVTWKTNVIPIRDFGPDLAEVSVDRAGLEILDVEFAFQRV